MKAKGLNAEKIGADKKSGITASYVRDLVSGKATNPSVSILVSLANKAGTDPLEILRVAAHLPPPSGDAWTAEEALETMAKVVRSPELTEIVRLLEDKDAEELKGVLATLKRKLGKPR